jgi:VWFA-related protein
MCIMPWAGRADWQVGQPAVEPAAVTPADPADRIVRVDAIVTDKAGAPIARLGPSDFAILDNGVAQKIESAEWRSNVPPAVGPVAPPFEITSAAEEERAAREPGTRVIAIYLDEFHVSAGESTERVRHALSRFLDDELRPADLVVVMKPLDHLSAIRFTRDRDEARKAVGSFEGRRNDYTPRTPFEEEYLGRSPAAVRAARAQIVMSGLRALAARMGELNGGLGAVVLMSEGFTTDVPRARERRLPDLQALVRAASRFRVLLYAFDPGPVPTAALSDVAATDADTASEISTLIQSLARDTGGDAVAAGQDLTSGLRRVAKDLDSYYVLTYKANNPNDGRFHTLEVTSSRRGAHVRARSGYWAPVPAELRTTYRSLLTPLVATRALKRSTFIDSWFGLTVEPDGSRRVIFTWTPAVPPTQPRRPAARADVVVLKVTTPMGTVLYDGEVAAAQPGVSVSSVRPDKAVIQTAPGRLQFDLTILQADGTKLDVGAQDFDVPNVRGATPVILPPQLFRAASAREFREISANSNAAPLPGREFRRTEWLLLRVPTFDPGGNAVQVSARLVNRVGSTVADLVAMPQETGQALAQFDLSLAPFAPGEYSIEVSATSTGGHARELIRFKITG